MKDYLFQRKTIYNIWENPQKKTDLNGVEVSKSGEVLKKECEKK